MSTQSPYAILRLPDSIARITSTRKASTFNYYGLVNSSLLDEAAKFIAQATDGAERELASTIEAFLQVTQSDCVGNADEKGACWITIRVTTPSTLFQIPRWHQDGRMYHYDEGREEVVRSKYGITLLGPPTLMLESNQHVLATLKEGEAQHYWWREKDGVEPSDDEFDDANDKLRKWLAHKFEGASRVRVEHDEVMRFSWGRDDSPIHSEPDLTSDRVFMTVLYGSESELRAMCEWRNVEFGKSYGG